MFNKILIANRGEIAMRVMRAAKEMGIKTVAVYSEEDSECLHLSLADEAICIGPASSDESYLMIPRIMSAAEITGADAIHPGYGFLAEKADFAEICKEHLKTFIGPPSSAIKMMGDKIGARNAMEKAGVPIIPGSAKPLKDYKEAEKLAKRIGYPILLKAAGGGGGKGIRIVANKEALVEQWNIATAEAEKSFGESGLYLEKLIQPARHIEIQILADNHKNCIYLPERECSIQVRHQKLIEESPSTGVDEKIRKELGRAAIKAVRAVGYINAGTVEFLLDEKNKFYFMEMNTRIQVEHPVTEMVTGIDIVKEQIRIAAGEKLNLTQREVTLSGHSIECRINAQDTENNFAPSTGKITSLHLPGGPGVRVDTHIYAGYKVPPHYDALLAKLIVHGRSREEAIIRARRCLDEFVIEGIETTIPFHQKMLSDEAFKKGNIHTQFTL
ncbi:MAG: acetyl-CoA carboxylase biotin carboxylase subunit [bacterium]|nr:acetyl-CoA carboxylase biotin carboxylase subunit [bacterium]